LAPAAAGQGDDDLGMRRIPARSGGIDQGRVARPARRQRVDAREQAIAAPRPSPPLPPLEERQPRNGRAGALELSHVLRAMLTPTGHGDLMVRETTRRIERARIEPLR